MQGLPGIHPGEVRRCVPELLLKSDRASAPDDPGKVVAVSAQQSSPGELPDGTDALYTVDELAAITGMTVRTTRYYAGLGLLPPPTRRGRMAYYSAQHRARLELIRALQDHGFTLAAIEKYLAKVPSDASVEDLAIQRAMLTSWKTGGHEVVNRRQLEARAGRKLDAEGLQRLTAMMSVEEVEDGQFEILPSF
jgi:DNA-binding transcriptional MerR regulator